MTLDGKQLFPHEKKVERSIHMRSVAGGFWVVADFDREYAEVFDVRSTELIGRLPLTYWSQTFPKACATLSGGVARINDVQKGSANFFPDGRAAMPGILGRPRWFKPEMRSGCFCYGRASFKQGDVWGHLDLAGRQAIAPQFYSDLPFQNGLARVRYPADWNSWDRYCYIDRNGLVVWQL